MAIIEFFKIKINNNEESDVNLNFASYLKGKLDEMSDSDKYCTQGKCDASMVDYIENENNITFDFIKFKKEKIYSTITSEPSDETDTFQALNDNIIESSTFTKKERKTVKKVIEQSNLSILEAKKKLEDTDIDKFSIYKILIDEELDIEEDKNKLSTLFYESNLERLRKFKTFFNVVYMNENYNILLLEKNKDGFDYKKLQNYINGSLLQKEDFYISIEYLYDNDFLKILENSVLQRFKFTIDLKKDSLLEDDSLTNMFAPFLTNLGKHKITITSDADKNSSLDNQKIRDFFYLLQETGLLESAKVKKQDHRREVDSLSKGEFLMYSDSSKLEILENANRIFQKAIDTKKDELDDDIWTQ